MMDPASSDGISVIDFRRQGMFLLWYVASGTWVACDVPPALVGVTLRSLDMGLLQAGAGMKGEFENRLRNVIDEVKASPKPIILFIDEAHTLIGAGGAAGQNDAANLLRPCQLGPVEQPRPSSLKHS